MVTCARIREEHFAERYLLGELSEADREAFERHYFECAECCEDLQTYPALLEGLQRRAASIRAEPLRQAVFPRWTWAAAAAVVAVVGLGLWLGRPVQEVQPPAPVAEPQPEPAPPSVPSLMELARVEKPPYTPATVRGTLDEASERFREAMQHYVNGDYETAIEGLRAASELNPEAPDVNFFLGICYLFTGETDLAIGRLEDTVAFGPSPYLEEAHFYLAKARLGKGELDAAEDELNQTIQLRGRLESTARELLGQLETLRQARR